MNIIAKCLNLREIKKESIEKYNGNIDITSILSRIEAPLVKNGKKQVEVSEIEIVQLIRRAKKQFANQPSLLRLSSPITVATGTLGYYKQLASIFTRCSNPRFVNYLFIGDYSGRGDSSIECLVALLCYKITMPNNFFMLRGCYESIGLSRSYNLYNQVCKRFSSRVWVQICQMFCFLPFAATIDDKIFCVHGGISPHLTNLQQINRIQRPLDTPDKDLPCDLVWSDPNIFKDGWNENERGVSFCYGLDVLSQFLHNNDLVMMVRGHEVVNEGYKMSANKKLVTICSQANYCQVYRNNAGIFNVDDQMNVYMEVVKEKNDHDSKAKEERSVKKIGNFIYET